MNFVSYLIKDKPEKEHKFYTYFRENKDLVINYKNKVIFFFFINTRGEKCYNNYLTNISKQFYLNGEIYRLTNSNIEYYNFVVYELKVIFYKKDKKIDRQNFNKISYIRMLTKKQCISYFNYNNSAPIKYNFHYINNFIYL